jgi:hypothetical protein
MGLGGRGAFRNETRTNRLERLHGFKVTRTAPRVARSPEEKEKLRAEAMEERERYRRERSMKGSPPSK